ncbi:MAG TPA: ATP-binding cassette domain-containing protein, partial [Polyangiaceae bacterium]|nr:ATP-binding cassette domain-containing protein [Polyangiaceae bacterium]
MPEPSLRLDNVTKRFGAVAAVRDASVEVRAGRLHAVVGENGAGKSTLLGLAGGVHAPDAGTVLIDGARLTPITPAEASRRGVGFVHQHFMLVEAFTCLENVMLGAEPVRRGGVLDPVAARRRLEKVLCDAQLEVELDARVDGLGVGERQTLEIVRILYRGARTILLDEPTAVLTPAQAESLFGTLRNLAADGAAIVVVTHRLS